MLHSHLLFTHRRGFLGLTLDGQTPTESLRHDSRRQHQYQVIYSPHWAQLALGVPNTASQVCRHHERIISVMSTRQLFCISGVKLTTSYLFPLTARHMQ